VGGRSCRSQQPKEKEKKPFKRQTFFPVGYHCNFTKPIFMIVMEARNKHNVKYIRPLISYHKFPKHHRAVPKFPIHQLLS